MVIRNKKSGHTQEVDQEGWEKLLRAGWKDKYTIIDGAPSPASKPPVPVPPEIANFARPLGTKQQQPAQNQEQQEPSGKAGNKKGA